MTATLAVRIADLAEARAVLGEAACRGIEIELVSQPWLAGFGGVAFVHALEQELGHGVTVDCLDKAGDVMAALRCGSRSLLFSGDAAVAARLVDVAAQLGGTVRSGTGLPEVDAGAYLPMCTPGAIATHGIGPGAVVGSHPPE
ncbi:MAG: hypothetical protein U1E45_08050 [Geminicoccaceae bacterium]